MSEIDFREIEKAMAERVNKAQDKKRQQQLKKVVKKRDEITKKAETARGQGTVATKRIIIGNKNLRSPAPLVGKSATVTTSSAIPLSSNTNPISDFRPAGYSQVHTPTAPPPLPSQTFEKEVLGSSSQTVGQLSDEYLQEQVSEQDTPEVPIGESTDTQETYVSPDEQDLLQEVDSQAAEELSAEDILGYKEEIRPQKEDQPSVDPTPPKQVDSTNLDDNLPESEDLAESLEDPTYDYGSVHRVYGQRISPSFNHYQQKSGSSKKEPTPSKSNAGKSPKPKKSKLSFLVYFLVLASLAVWAGAAYLYFIY